MSVTALSTPNIPQFSISRYFSVPQSVPQSASTSVNDIFLDTHGNETSEYSLSRDGSFYWTDHNSTSNDWWVDPAEFEPGILVKTFNWFYEHRGYYKHSYIVLETIDGSFFVVEKNNVGVVWYRSDTFNEARYNKLEHD